MLRRQRADVYDSVVMGAGAAKKQLAKILERTRSRKIDVGATETAACVIRRLHCIFPFGRPATAKAYPFTRQLAPPCATRHFVRHRDGVLAQEQSTARPSATPPT